MAALPLITDAGPEIAQAIRAGFTALTVSLGSAALAIAYALWSGRSGIRIRVRGEAWTVAGHADLRLVTISLTDQAGRPHALDLPPAEAISLAESLPSSARFAESPKGA